LDPKRTDTSFEHIPVIYLDTYQGYPFMSRFGGLCNG